MTSNLGKSCLPLTEGNFWQNSKSNKIWTMQRMELKFSGYFLHEGILWLSFNKIWDVTHRTIWRFDMELPLCVDFLIQSKLLDAQIIVAGLFPRSQNFSYFCQIVNDVNIELVIFALYTRYYDDCLQTNGKLKPKLFWNDDLYLSKTGYQKFATSLFNFILLCNTFKSISFDLRNIEK